MKFSELISSESKYLSAKDLDGKEVQVVIHRYTHEELEEKDKSKHMKWVVWFRGKEKGVVLNKTNCEMLGSLFADTEESIGKPVILYIVPTELGPGIRIRGVSAPAEADVPF